jgi:hypothetical protein
MRRLGSSETLSVEFGTDAGDGVEENYGRSGVERNGRQKMVRMIEVRDYVLQGWEFVNNLPNGEAIIRLSDSS